MKESDGQLPKRFGKQNTLATLKGLTNRKSFTVWQNVLMKKQITALRNAISTLKTASFL